MSRNNPLFWGLALLLLLVQVSWATPSLPPIINVHESIEDVTAVLKLQETMKALNIRTTVLHAIPQEFLHYSGKEISLSKVEGSNDLVQQISAQTAAQGSFDFFCTVDLLDLNNTETLEKCLDAGASGLKLYNGYSYSHVLPLDDAKITPLYTLLEEKGAILMLPVNAGGYQSELENVLSLHPDLEVICPHYCLSSKSLNRLTDLMNRFPNLYVDTSFGKTSYAKEGFETISANGLAYQSFFETFQDRILFATDNVVTNYEDKDEDFLKDLYQDYIWILSEGTFNSDLDDDPENGTTVHTGLNLPYTTLQKVFWKNWQDLLE